MTTEKLMVHEPHLLANKLRSQACKVVAEMKASSVVRRALLRKTAASLEQARQILPGSLAAYWRWSRKAYGRKRGGHVLGRCNTTATTSQHG